MQPSALRHEGSLRSGRSGTSPKCRTRPAENGTADPLRKITQRMTTDSALTPALCPAFPSLDCLSKMRLERLCCSLYVHDTALSNPILQTGLYGGSDCHHRENQPGERRPRRCWLSLRRHSSGRGPFIRPARTRGCCAGLETLVTNPSAARRPLQHSPGRG